MNWEDRITTNPKVMVGKPVVRGTRLTVEFILGRFADGWTEREVLDSYPNLSLEDLREVVVLAANRRGRIERVAVRGADRGEEGRQLLV